jgi:hypothetical protein
MLLVDSGEYLFSCPDNSTSRGISSTFPIQQQINALPSLSCVNIPRPYNSPLAPSRSLPGIQRQSHL